MIRRLGRLFVFAALLCAAPAHADERILSYDSVVEVMSDGSLDVTETIRVRAEGHRINRGIYRDFPTRYEDRYGNNVVVGFEMLGVERNGRTEPWFTERHGNGIRINTGNDDFIERPAVHTYTLRYRTTRQLGFFDGHDELYWNAIGTGWAFPIDTGSVEVRLPEPVPVAGMHAEGYTGPQGARGQAYAAELTAPGVARWHLTRPLAPEEGLTIVLTFPKGIVAEPTGAQRAAWLLADNRGVLIALAGLVAMLVYCIRRWRQVGRDPRAGTIIARYEPPEGYSPAELRYLRRRTYDTRCFTADILDLAVHGHLRLHRQERRLLGDRWSIERIDVAGAADATSAQQALLAGLFPARSAPLFELRRKDAQTSLRLRTAMHRHRQALDRRLHPSHFRRNGASIGIATLIGPGAGALAFVLADGGGLPLIAVACVAMVLVLLVFAILVAAPTPEGRRLLDEIEGLKLYLGVAEREELARMDGPDAPPALDAGRYERLLPYAIALKVEDAWTDRFTDSVGEAAAREASTHIAWYSGGGIDSLAGLTQQIGSSLNSAIASASTPPGSSSGAGGGGSSGGGGGGGGGGGR
jgi:hypothetical protein